MSSVTLPLLREVRGHLAAVVEISLPKVEGTSCTGVVCKVTDFMRFDFNFIL